MDRLISLQAAIDVLHMDTSIIPFRKAREYADATIEEIRNRLEKLPSAQPGPSTEIQEILDYLDNTIHPIVSPDNWNVYAELHDMVSKLLSAQPKRKTGRWVKRKILEQQFVQNGYYLVCCSECGMETTPNKLMGISLFGEEEPHFCPNCGAKMRGENDDIPDDIPMEYFENGGV